MYKQTLKFTQVYSRILSLFILFLMVETVNAQDTFGGITIDNILKLKSVSDIQISPNGKWVAYTITENDIKKDKPTKQIYKIPIIGGEAIAITNSDYSASQPRWKISYYLY